MKPNIKVARIIDEYKVVINAGFNDGISNGTTVMLYDLDEMIIDPDTGNELGVLEIVKGTGTVTHAQAAMATVESNMKEEVQKKVIQKRIPGIFEPTPNLFGRTTTEEIPLITKPFKDVHTGTLVKIISKR